jgi:anti-sigma B factor antagonist
MITESRTRTIEPDIKVVEISGRLNLGNSLQSVESSIKRLIAEGARKLVIDLSGLNFIDSAGIGMLVICGGEMEKAGGQSRIAGAHGIVAQAFNTVHIGRIVPLDPDLQSSVGNFGKNATVVDPINSDAPRDRIRDQTIEHAQPPRLEDEGQSGG